MSKIKYFFTITLTMLLFCINVDATSCDDYFLYDTDTVSTKNAFVFLARLYGYDDMAVSVLPQVLSNQYVDSTDNQYIYAYHLLADPEYLRIMEIYNGIVNDSYEFEFYEDEILFYTQTYPNENTKFRESVIDSVKNRQMSVYEFLIAYYRMCGVVNKDGNTQKDIATLAFTEGLSFTNNVEVLKNSVLTYDFLEAFSEKVLLLKPMKFCFTDTVTAVTNSTYSDCFNKKFGRNVTSSDIFLYLINGNLNPKYINRGDAIVNIASCIGINDSFEYRYNINPRVIADEDIMKNKEKIAISIMSQKLGLDLSPMEISHNFYSFRPDYKIKSSELENLLNGLCDSNLSFNRYEFESEFVTVEEFRLVMSDFFKLPAEYRCQYNTSSKDTVFNTDLIYGENLAYCDILTEFNIPKKRINVESNENGNVSVNNGETVLSFKNAPYINEKGTTMVPIRELADKIGLSVEWNDEKRGVCVISDKRIAEYYIDLDYCMVDGKFFYLKCPAILVNNISYIPLRNLCENLEYEVLYFLSK